MTTRVSTSSASPTGEDISGVGVADEAVDAGSAMPSYAELMNGTVGVGFFGPEQRCAWTAEGKDGQGVPKPACGPVRAVDWDHDETLPLPSPAEMKTIKFERDASPQGTPPEKMGPTTRMWYQRVRVWLHRMRHRYQPGRTHVTGSWRKNWKAWKQRLRKLPKKRQRRVLQLLMQGVELPFDEVPKGPLRTLRNHKQLAERSDVVWSTVKEMLEEGSVVAHDCQGRDDVDVLPQGMFAIRWVRKGDSEKVRITINMRPLNAYLLSDCSEVELATLQRITSLWQRNDEQVTMDMHSSYYHLELNDEASQWSGFSVCDSELPEPAVSFLKKQYAACRWRDRWVFRYRGMAMGASPSAARYCECADALIDSWRGRTVGRAVGLEPRAVRATGYIDDSLFLVQQFARGVEMGLRLALEYIICGFWLNLDKTVVLPRLRCRYLGVIANSVTLHFSLPKSRCDKVKRAIAAVRLAVSSSPRVELKLLAKLIGNLWAIHVVCRKAVGIMCRSMIAVLSGVLRQQWIRDERDPYRLKHLLKRVWSGSALWTQAAEAELRFWEKVVFSLLCAPMRQWDAFPDARDCLFRPKQSRLHDSVRILAADTSDHTSGGAEFVVAKDRLSLIPDRSMVVPLSAGAIGESSTFGELEGLCKVYFTFLRGSTCRRAFLLVDNISAVGILQRGSKWEKLNFFAKVLFLQSLALTMLLCPLWFRRNRHAIVEVDTRSRLRLTSEYALPMHLFWRANAIARSLWGLGFQFDRFASTMTVMPTDGQVKLPFNSEFWQPGSSGRNALAQNWEGVVNWVNAPFCLLDQVLGLLKLQHAVAAVVVPRANGSRWDAEVVKGSEGFCTEFGFNPRLRKNWMVGAGRNTYMGLYAVVFVDFRVGTSSSFANLRPVERLRKSTITAGLGVGDGDVVYTRLRNPLGREIPSLNDVITLPCGLR